VAGDVVYSMGHLQCIFLIFLKDGGGMKALPKWQNLVVLKSDFREIRDLGLK
jgi:uncharacterized alpha/beta hydrolase family protein